MKKRTILFIVLIFLVTTISAFIYTRSSSKTTKKVVSFNIDAVQKLPDSQQFKEASNPVFSLNTDDKDFTKELLTYKFTPYQDVLSKFKSMASSLGFTGVPSEISKGIWDVRLNNNLLTFDSELNSINYTFYGENPGDVALFNSPAQVLEVFKKFNLFPAYLQPEINRSNFIDDNTEGPREGTGASIYNLSLTINKSVPLVIDLLNFNPGSFKVKPGSGVVAFSLFIPPENIKPDKLVRVFTVQELLALLNSGKGALIQVHSLNSNTFEDTPRFNTLNIDLMELYYYVDKNGNNIRPVYRVVATSKDKDAQSATYFVAASEQ